MKVHFRGILKMLFPYQKLKMENVCSYLHYKIKQKTLQWHH